MTAHERHPMASDPNPSDGGHEPAVAVVNDSGQSTDESQSRVTALFEEQSPRWETIYEGRDVVSVIHQYRLALALSWVDAARLSAGSHVLELGCGAGLASVALAQRGLTVLATDVVDVMMDRARERVCRAGLEDRVRVERADAHELRFPDGSFDLVLALGVLPWLHSPARAAGEMARVLRSGGLLIATIGNRLRLPWLLDPLYSPALARLRRALKDVRRRIGRPWQSPAEPYTHPLDDTEWRALLDEAGFDVVRSTTFGFGPFTVLGREILPDRLSVSLDRRLQRLAERHVPIVRSTGAQHLALARKRAP